MDGHRHGREHPDGAPAAGGRPGGRLLRAASPEEPGTRRALVIGEVEPDVNTRRVRVDGRAVRLPPREFEPPRHPIRNAHRTVTREQITRHVWNSAEAAATDTVAAHVNRLRARLGDEDERLTQTVRGGGYRLSGGIS